MEPLRYGWPLRSKGSQLTVKYRSHPGMVGVRDCADESVAAAHRPTSAAITSVRTRMSGSFRRSTAGPRAGTTRFDSPWFRGPAGSGQPRRNAPRREGPPRSGHGASGGGRFLAALPVREPQTQGDEAQPEDGQDRDGLSEHEGPQPGRRERAQGQEDGHARCAGALERPEPEKIADAAAEADEDDGGPAAAGDTRQGAKDTFAIGEPGEEDDRCEHGEGA